MPFGEIGTCHCMNIICVVRHDDGAFISSAGFCDDTTVLLGLRLFNIMSINPLFIGSSDVKC